MKEFSNWHEFNDLFEYKGLTSANKKDWVRKSALSSGYFLEINGELSAFNEHNGFIFKENFGLKKNSVGLYFLKIFTKKTGTKVYIGKSESPTNDHGIPYRLQDHFRKIQVLPARDRDQFLELAKDPRFGGKGYKLAWDRQKKEFSRYAEELTDKDTDIRKIKQTHGIILGKFKSYIEVSDKFTQLKLKKSNDNQEKKWRTFNKKLKDTYKADIYEPSFWNKNCQIAFLHADDILEGFRDIEDSESENRLLNEDIDKAEKMAIKALRKNFDYDDILNQADMSNPKLICDISKNLAHKNFDLNSVHKRSQELILNNAKIILEKLNHEGLNNWFISVLEKISESSKDYYLKLSLASDSDFRIASIIQRKTSNNFMVFEPKIDHIYCKCILSHDDLNNFFEKNNLDTYVSTVKKVSNEGKNIKSSFKIKKLKKNNWLNQLINDCYDRFNKKYPYKKREEINTPNYGKKSNGGTPVS